MKLTIILEKKEVQSSNFFSNYFLEKMFNFNEKFYENFKFLR